MMKDQHQISLEITSLSSVVAGLPKNSPFQAPDGYFTNFPDKILDQIKSQDIEIEQLSPLLQTLKQENPFSIPPDYLTKFNVAAPQSETKVIPLFGVKQVLKYAVAAAVIGIIATFAALFLSNEQTDTIAKSTAETKISTDAFAQYLSETEELEKNEIETPIEDMQSLLVQMDASLVSEILKEIPENEISTYIDLIQNEDLQMMN